MCGGDPLTYPNIELLILEIKKIGLKVNLDTVGLSMLSSQKTVFPVADKHINQTSINIIKNNIDMLGIPLDGSNQEVLSEFRKYDGDLFANIMELLRLLKNHRVNVCINTVLHSKNYNDIQNIVNIVSKYVNIKKMQIFQFCPIGYMAYANKNNFLISDKLFFETVSKISHEKNLIIEAKSNAFRKNKYCFVNCFGDIFVPEKYSIINNQVKKSEITKIGNIHDKDIFEKLPICIK